MEKLIANQAKDSLEYKGVVTFTKFVIDSPRAEEIHDLLERAGDTMTKQSYDFWIRELGKVCKTEQKVVNNMCVRAGRNVQAGILNGEVTYTGAINYGLLGTSSTAVADTDTQLGAEVKRKAIATRTRANDQINFDFYFSKSDISGTFQEFGMVIDGNASANTGQLFNRLLTGGWTKSSSEALTASVQININHT